MAPKDLDYYRSVFNPANPPNLHNVRASVALTDDLENFINDYIRTNHLQFSQDKPLVDNCCALLNNMEVFCRVELVVPEFRESLVAWYVS